ncbi:MAG: ligase-associated DNA damage response endonuclease PdeM [Bacteroidota bacterium]
MYKIELQGETFFLHPEKAVFWESESILLLADLHLGKGAHFRKAGIAVPVAVQTANFNRLRKTIEDCEPQRVLFLGDLFHSHHNHVWELLKEFITAYPRISFELVPGNHDILAEYHYAASLLDIHPAIYEVSIFTFSHHPLSTTEQVEGKYNFCGHIHPSVRLRSTNGKGGLRVPCFYFGKHQAILPAFGEFTGTANIKVEEGDRIFVPVEGQVIGL